MGLAVPGMSYRGVWALIFGRLRRGCACGCRCSSSAASAMPCLALLPIPALETWALLWPGLLPAAELMAG